MDQVCVADDDRFIALAFAAAFAFAFASAALALALARALLAGSTSLCVFGALEEVGGVGAGGRVAVRAGEEERGGGRAWGRSEGA